MRHKIYSSLSGKTLLSLHEISSSVFFIFLCLFPFVHLFLFLLHLLLHVSSFLFSLINLCFFFKNFRLHISSFFWVIIHNILQLFFMEFRLHIPSLSVIIFIQFLSFFSSFFTGFDYTYLLLLNLHSEFPALHLILSLPVPLHLSFNRLNLSWAVQSSIHYAICSQFSLE